VWRRLLLTALLVPGLALAADPALELTAPDEAVTVGDRVTVTIRAVGGEGLVWGDPVPAPDSRTWAVVRAPAAVPGVEPPAWQMVVAPLATGRLPLPEVSVTVRDGEGRVRQVASTGTGEVTVASVLPPGEEKVEPAPLADPVGVRGFPWEWVLPIGLPLLVLALLGWWLWRRRRGGAGAGVAATMAPLEELRAVVDTLLGSLGDIPDDTICDRMAGGARRFLERSTGEPVLEMTTFEVLRLARRSGWPTEALRAFQRALELADRVRFARVAATPAELRDALEGLRAGAAVLESWWKPAGDEEAA